MDYVCAFGNQADFEEIFADFEIAEAAIEVKILNFPGSARMGWEDSRRPLGINSTVMLYAFAVAIVTGVLFGLAPARTLLRSSLVESLGEGDVARREQAGGNGARWWLRRLRWRLY